jgi:hypothetical protein
MDDALKEIRSNISKLTDEELQQMVTVDADDYVPEAIEIARREIEARGISLSAPHPEPDRRTRSAPEDEKEVEESVGQAAGITPSASTCPFCNGPVRRAALLGDNEIIAVFRDDEEQRYVDVLVCTRCGEARLVVDLRSPVTEE